MLLNVSQQQINNARMSCPRSSGSILHYAVQSARACQKMR